MTAYIEKLAQQLAGLYESYGYMSYSMSKFEEYELYLRNKDFLISDRVLTFTDTDGKLMALKPDVTLSIIKNTRDAAGMQKLYYRENVYRPGNGAQGFREIMQIGLEAMGDVDNYSMLEVLLLAIRSLQAVSPSCVLDISHMGLLSRLLDKSGVTDGVREQILSAIGSKNAHELRKLCQSCGAEETALVKLAKLSGRVSQVLPQLEALFGDTEGYGEFAELLQGLEQSGAGQYVNVDFSVVNDMRYYNGIAFRGFVEGVPDGILAGGQYDALMTKMGRKTKAVGFALYPDLLARMPEEQTDSACVCLVLYDKGVSLAQIAQAVDSLVQKGYTVKAQPAGTACQPNTKLFRLTQAGMKEVVENA